MLWKVYLWEGASMEQIWKWIIDDYKEDMCEKEQVWKCMKKGASMKMNEKAWKSKENKD